MKKFVIVFFAITLLFPFGAGAKTLRLAMDADPVSLDPHVQLSGGMLHTTGDVQRNLTPLEKTILIESFLYGTGQTEIDSRSYDFMWTLGLGVDKGNWGLDLALEEDDVHSGYLPLNGSVSEDPIAYLTAWLSW